MKEFIFYVILVAMLAAFVLTLLRKWGVIEWVQVHGNDFFAKMLVAISVCRGGRALFCPFLC